MPARALEYAALRRAATEANDAFDRTSRCSGTTATAADDDDASLDANAESAEEEGRRLRARLRWRMALMGIRFTHNLALQQREVRTRTALARGGAIRPHVWAVPMSMSGMPWMDMDMVTGYAQTWTAA